MFTLDPRLEASSLFVIDLTLCQARLQDDARWPWIVLVPRRLGLKELEDLESLALAALTREILAAGRAVRAMGLALGRPVEKLNVGALGNVVEQLHVHVVGRRRDDPAWPGPVWGFGEPAVHPQDGAASRIDLARRALAPDAS